MQQHTVEPLDTHWPCRLRDAHDNVTMLPPLCLCLLYPAITSTAPRFARTVQPSLVGAERSGSLFTKTVVLSKMQQEYAAASLEPTAFVLPFAASADGDKHE